MLDWLSRKDKSCSPFGQCCPGSQNFSLSQMRCVNPEERGNRKLDVNDTKCEDDDHVFCERLHVCLPKHANCTKPERFNFFSVSKFANQSGMFIFLYCLSSSILRLTGRIEGWKKTGPRESGVNQTYLAELVQGQFEGLRQSLFIVPWPESRLAMDSGYEIGALND